MPNWKDLQDQLKAAGSSFDIIRRQHLKSLFEKTGRNVIVYYSGWLQKADLARQVSGFELNDNDKNGFMAAIHQLDRKKGLDLILHTPGGEIAATESLVDYLHSMFSDIRAVIPQIAMSAGTMVALAANQVLMGKHSSLGPIDPQINGLPAHGIVDEFIKAAKQIQENMATIPLWQPIIAKYHPTLIGECEKAIEWSREIVRTWLVNRMFANAQDAGARADRIVADLGSHELTKSHARHISMKKAQELGIRVTALEDDPELQERVLTVHHACIQTLAGSPAIKIIENQNGVAFVQSLQLQTIPQ